LREALRHGNSVGAALGRADNIELVNIAAVRELVVGVLSEEQHHELGTETSGEAKSVATIVRAASGEVQRRQVRVDRLQVGDGRHETVVERRDSHDVLDIDGHGVAGEALGVADDDVVVVGLGEGVFECVDLDLGARCGAGLVRVVDELGGHVVQELIKGHRRASRVVRGSCTGPFLSEARAVSLVDALEEDLHILLDVGHMDQGSVVTTVADMRHEQL